MLTVITRSSTLLGVEGQSVSVEVQLSNGLPSFQMVGLPDAACREARDRVRAAILSSEFDWVRRRLTVNLAPSGFRKGGSVLDLAVAVGVLAVTRQLPAETVASWAFVGELGLDGSLRSVPGIVPLVHSLDGWDLVVPHDAHHLASQVPRRGRLRSAGSLAEVAEALGGTRPWPDPPAVAPPAPPAPEPDLRDVLGHAQGRLACEVAAAGGHHLLLLGPPGAGKTMLARRISGLLPPLDPTASLEATLVHSAAGLDLSSGMVERPPVRSPHHSSSMVSLVGGGSAALRPGEVSLSHRGVLLLDEMGEFAPSALEALRQPLEEGLVRVSRARGSCVFPADFLLVAAMNPCPCGEAGRPGRCRCSEAARQRYARRLSGPLLDRFDLRVMVPRPSTGVLLSRDRGEASREVADRVAAARGRANERGVSCNAELGSDRLAELATVTQDGAELLTQQLDAGLLSGRGLDRVKLVALTLADLAGADPVLDRERLSLALGLRIDAGQLLAAVGA